MKKISLLGLILIVLQACQTKDKQPPFIFLIGDNPMTVSLNKNFKDPGAYADDNRDKDITNKLTMTHNVPINGPANGEGTTKDTGTFYSIWTCKDAAGNVGTATRTIHVVNDARVYQTKYELTVNATIGNIFHDTTLASVDLTVDSRTNMKIWFPKMAGKTTFRAYGMIAFDTTDNYYHITIPKQYHRRDENNVKYLYLFANEDLASLINESKILDTITPLIDLKYKVYKYRYNQGIGTVLYNDTLWDVYQDDVIHDHYIRY